MSSFKDLQVWQESHKLIKDIYVITDKFPAKERYRLTEQICRAAASIAANIAEGTGRYSKADFTKFLYISRGSLEETRNFLILACDLGYIEKKTFQSLDQKCILISKMLNGLIRSVNKLSPKT
jgi:four helix bundle protein